jgi:hypothetical protein
VSEGAEDHFSVWWWAVVPAATAPLRAQDVARVTGYREIRALNPPTRVHTAMHHGFYGGHGYG